MAESAVWAGGAEPFPWSERLRRWREDTRGWSQAEFCEHYVYRAGHLGEFKNGKVAEISTKDLWRWESGSTKRIHYQNRRVLVAMGAPTPDPPRADSRTGPGPDDHGIAEEDRDVRRKDFLKLALGVGAGAGLGAATGRGLDVLELPPERVGHPRVGKSDVDVLRKVADELRRADQERGASTIVGDAVRAYRHAKHLLDDGDYTRCTGDELVVAVGDLALCAGWLSFDHDDLPSARTLYSSAFELSLHSQDADLAIHAMSSIAHLSLERAERGGGDRRGHARHAIRSSQAALSITDDRFPRRLHALLATRLARAHALSAERSDSMNAIASARRAIDDDAGRPSSMTWLDFVNHHEVAYHEAMIRAEFGGAEKAIELLSASATDDSSPRNSLYSRAQLARVMAADGDTAGAAAEASAVGASVLERGIGSRRSAGLAKRVLLATGHHPGPRDL